MAVTAKKGLGHHQYLPVHTTSSRVLFLARKNAFVKMSRDVTSLWILGKLQI